MKGHKARIICNDYTPNGVVVVDVVVTVFAAIGVGVVEKEYVKLLYIMVFKFITF
jgi:hypothetical protein